MLGPVPLSKAEEEFLRPLLINIVNKKTTEFSCLYSVLKIKAEKDVDSKYEVVCDFSIKASRENSVSLFKFLVCIGFYY